MILILINVRHAIHVRRKKVYIAQMHNDILGNDTVLQSIVEVSRRFFQFLSRLSKMLIERFHRCKDDLHSSDVYICVQNVNCGSQSYTRNLCLRSKVK